MTVTEPRRGRGGRPRLDPEAVRSQTIGVRVSPTEFEALQVKAAVLGLTPAHYLREAALKRRLPDPPVPAVNREQYAELARLAANLNQLTRLANEGASVTVTEAHLQRLAGEVNRLRLALIGLERGA